MADRQTVEDEQTALGQPIPHAGQEHVFDAVRRLVDEREQLGITKYRQTLQTFDGRDPLADALMEAIDLAVYLTKAWMERQARRDAEAAVIAAARAVADLPYPGRWGRSKQIGDTFSAFYAAIQDLDLAIQETAPP